MPNSPNHGLTKYLMAAIFLVALLLCLLTGAILLKPQVSNNSSSDGGYTVTFPPTLLLKLKPLSGDGNVSDTQLSQTKGIIELRLSEYGPDTSVRSLRDDNGDALLFAQYGNISYADAVSLVTTPGQFEMRIQADGNETRHILYGDDIRNASVPLQQTPGNELTTWNVIFGFTDQGAQKFWQACIDAGATRDPENHTITLLLDGTEIYSATLSPAVASNLDAKPMDTMMIKAGIGNSGHIVARRVSACLQAGSLPVKVEIMNPTSQ